MDRFVVSEDAPVLPGPVLTSDEKRVEGIRVRGRDVLG